MALHSDRFYQAAKRPLLWGPEIWHRTPLNWRMVTVIVCLLAAGLGLTGLSLVGILQSHLLAQVDRDINRVANRIGDPCLNLSDREQASGSTVIHFNNVGGLSSYYFRVKCSGVTTEETPTQTPPVDLDSQNQEEDVNPELLSPKQLPNPKVLDHMEQVTQTAISIPITVPSVDGKTSWRAINRPTPNNDGTYTVAFPLTKTQETIRNTQIYVSISSLFIVIIGGVVSYYLVTFSLMPVRKIKEVAGQIAAGDLHQRIQTKEAPNTEVGSLAVSLNRMLSHIDSAFETQKRSEEKVRQFVSDASHELRTPLAAIRGYGELYRIGGVPSERVEEVMSRIESEATRMGELVEDLLKLARLDERRRVTFSTVNLTEIAAAARLDLTALSPKRPVKLINLDGTPLDKTQPLIITGDRNLLVQVLTNLIGNVDRYTGSEVATEIAVGYRHVLHQRTAQLPGGAKSSSIQKRQLEDSQLQVILEVRDHGPGIPESARPRVFERFYRDDSSRSRQTGGTGLGLSIVDAIAKIHGGTAEALETPGGGTTIRITFPYRAPAEQNGQSKPR